MTLQETLTDTFIVSINDEGSNECKIIPNCVIIKTTPKGLTFKECLELSTCQIRK